MAMEDTRIYNFPSVDELLHFCELEIIHTQIIRVSSVDPSSSTSSYHLAVIHKLLVPRLFNGLGTRWCGTLSGQLTDDDETLTEWRKRTIRKSTATYL
jgi:hypothetical protein